MLIRSRKAFLAHPLGMGLCSSPGTCKVSAARCESAGRWQETREREREQRRGEGKVWTKGKKGAMEEHIGHGLRSNALVCFVSDVPCKVLDNKLGAVDLHAIIPAMDKARR